MYGVRVYQSVKIHNIFAKKSYKIELEIISVFLYY